MDYAISIVDYVDTNKEDTFFYKKKKKKQQKERLLIRIKFGKCFNIILSILTGPLLSLPLTLFWDESKTAWNPHFFQNFSSTFHSHQASFSTIFTSIQIDSINPYTFPLSCSHLTTPTPVSNTHSLHSFFKYNLWKHSPINIYSPKKPVANSQTFNNQNPQQQKRLLVSFNALHWEIRPFIKWGIKIINFCIHAHPGVVLTNFCRI